MDYVIRDARKTNPNIKILVTLEFGNEGEPSTGNIIERVFSIPGYSPQQNAQHFASNLMRYLEKYDLDGFDIDWEDPLSTVTTKEHFGYFINGIGALFKQRIEKEYYLTISPAVADNMDYTAINNHVDFVNLQLYSGFTYPSDFSGIKGQLLAYGAKCEAMEPVTNPVAVGYQTAQQAYQDNNENYRYSIFANWRLTSENFEFEQDQQKALHKLIQS
jgi:GH18 family chitinase